MVEEEETEEAAWDVSGSEKMRSGDQEEEKKALEEAGEEARIAIRRT